MKMTGNTKKNQKNGIKTSTKPVLAMSESKPAAPVREMRTAPATKTVTTIEAKIDVGFGNHLFVRGEGPGLSWEHGTPLKCIDPQTWQLSVEAKDPLKIKLLLNDAIWMTGEDLVVPPGKRVEITPAF